MNNAKKTLVTVIIPVRNGEKYIEECLKSVLKQTYRELEILVVDDASDDNTIEILRKYEKIDSRINVTNLVDKKGVSQARNIALDNAAGEYVAFIDGDDYIADDYIERLYDEINEKYDLVCSGYYEVKNNEMKKFTLSNKDCDNINESYDVYLDNFNATVLMQSVWGKLFKKDIIRNIRFENLMYGEDELFFVKVLIQNVHMKNIDYVGYYYRQYNESTLTKAQLKREVFIQDVIMVQYLIALEMTRVSGDCKEKSRNNYKETVLSVCFRLKRWKHDKKAFIATSKIVRSHIAKLKSLCKLSIKEKTILYMYSFFPRLMWVMI